MTSQGVPLPLVAETEDRYSRLQLAGWKREVLRSARVLVAGAGALGNEVIKNLALLGIGSMLIVDFDTIEVSNLSRSVLFRQEDVGHHKAHARHPVLGGFFPIAVLFWKGPWLIDMSRDPYESYDVSECQPEVAARLFAVMEAREAEMARNPRGWRD